MTRRLLFALLAMGIAQAGVYLIRPTTSYRILALGEGAREVGLVAAAFALLPIFLAVPLGRLSDRRGAPLLLIGCAVQTGGGLLLALTETTATIAAASAVVGLGHLALALGAQDVVARESRSDRHDHHFGLLTAGVSFGQLLGPLAAGFLLGASATPSVATTCSPGCPVCCAPSTLTASASMQSPPRSTPAAAGGPTTSTPWISDPTNSCA